MTRPSEAEVRNLLERAADDIMCPNCASAKNYCDDCQSLKVELRATAAALSTPPLPSAEPVHEGDGLTWTEFRNHVARVLADAGQHGLRVAFLRRCFTDTTPPAAAQDTGRLDWLEENGGRISGPADDSPRFVIWGDTDAQDVQGETLREAIDNAMDAARAAGGE